MKLKVYYYDRDFHNVIMIESHFNNMMFKTIEGKTVLEVYLSNEKRFNIPCEDIVQITI